MSYPEFSNQVVLDANSLDGTALAIDAAIASDVAAEISFFICNNSFL